jgi:hypothetical protein
MTTAEIPILDLQTYYTRVREYQEQNPELRRGQALFNVLHDIRPDLAEMVRGTDIDPFYAQPDDHRIQAFTQWMFDRAHKEDI